MVATRAPYISAVSMSPGPGASGGRTLKLDAIGPTDDDTRFSAAGPGPVRVFCPSWSLGAGSIPVPT